MSRHLRLVHSQTQSVEPPRIKRLIQTLQSRRDDHRRAANFRRSNLFGMNDPERGAVTAEYAIVIMAAVAFAGLLVVIMRSSEVRGMLTQLVENALQSAG